MGLFQGKRMTRPPAQPAAASHVSGRMAKGMMVAVVLLTALPVAAFGWTNGGGGSSASKARSMPAGNTPATSISGRNVTVNWTASSFSGGGPNVSGYVVKRYNTSGVEQSIGAGCSGTVSSTSCTESNVDPGSWKYSVTPKQGNNWLGTESAPSATRTVSSPSFTLSSWANVNSLPASLNGNLENFKTGATVTYRLDNPTTGTVLTATTTPSTIGNNGSATVSVTIPSGTSNGSHIVYAIGSSGDQASARITVNVCASPGTQTMTATADSYVEEASPTATNGGSSDLFAESKSGAANRRTYVKFSLPSLPSGCAVTAASLQMYSTAATSGRTIQAQRVTADWTEAAITWNTKAASTTSGQATSTSGTGTRSWAVTSIVKDMYDSGNYGFVLQDSVESSATTHSQKYQSKEGTPDTQDPKLVVTLGADNNAQFALTSSGTITTLPTAVNGELSSFATGSTVTYRLDDPTTGTVLSGSTTPSTIGSSGQGDASVTLPEGISNGSHKIYAVSSSGDIAKVTVTVALPTITTPAWGLSDVSSGTAVDQSDATAFNDGRVYPTDTAFGAGSFNSAFAANRYYSWTYASALPSGRSTTGVTFDFRFAAVSPETACFYFEVIDNGTVIGTHGSTTPGTATSPWCTDSTEKLVSTPLPEVTTSDIANGIQIKVYGYQSASKPIIVDQAVVSGSAGGDAFTLYETTGTNAADGTGETLPWMLAAEDGATGSDYFFTDSTNWGVSFLASRYVQLSFPSYVPADADIETVSFMHRYQAGSGSTVCYYVEAFSGGTSIGTTPNPPGTNGQSCAVGTGSWVSEEVPLNGVDTAAELNGLVLRLYYRTSAGGGTKDREDYTALRVTYD